MMMKHTVAAAVVVLATLAVVSAGAQHFDFLKNVKGLDGSPRQQQPAIRAGGFCRDRFIRWECPFYEYIPDFGLEFRYYPGPITFVTATAYGPPGNLLAGFELTGYHVESYFNGSNSAKTRYFPGMPVQVSVEGRSIVEWYYTTWFIFPRNETVPAPLSPYVTVFTIPAGSGFLMATQNFAPTPLLEDGNQNAERVIFGAAHGLHEILAAIGAPVYEDIYWFNDFQPAFVRQNRRHENWFEIRQQANGTSTLSALLREARTEDSILRM